MLSSILFAVAHNNSRPSLNGALFDIKDNRIIIVGADTSMLALRRGFDGIVANKATSSELNFIVPGNSLSELLKLIGDEDEQAEIELTRKHIIISIDNIIFFSRLIESEFLDYRRVVKTEPKITIVIDAKSFAESIERAAILTEDKQKTPVKLILNFKKQESTTEKEKNAGILQITFKSSLGEACDECSIEMYGENLQIGFNHRYLLDSLKAAREEKIMLKFESPTKPLIMLPYNEDNKDLDIQNYMDIENSKFLYVVMPVRLSN